VGIRVVEGQQTVEFGLILTLALAALVLLIGSYLQRRVSLLSQSNIPGPVVGGLLFAFVAFVLHVRAVLNISINSVLRDPLQIAFFTTIGLGATLSLLRSGGRRMALFSLIVAGTAVVQNVVGIVVARAIGAPDVLGIICGSLTLAGGPATGLAFTATFERMGVEGAGR
jgi:ESS family glutamate:Na+ symporter